MTPLTHAVLALLVFGGMSFAHRLDAASDAAPPISPHLVGVNLWLTPDAPVWAQMAKAGVKTVRIGGHQYDRQPPSPEQLLAWVQQIQAMGAEPMVQVSQYQSAADAARWVHFLNVQHKRAVRYWNIGNEPWLQADKPPWPTVTARIQVYVQSFAEAMKAVDPSIRIYAPDLSYFEPEAFTLLFGGEHNIGGKVPNRPYYYVDGFSYHDYPQRPGDPARDGAEKMVNTVRRVKEAVDAANRRLGRAGQDALQWGLGEFNSATGARVHSWGNGQMFAQVLGACMQYGATYAATWSMFESDGNRGATDFSLIDGTGAPRASYHHMAAISHYFTGIYVPGTSSNSDVVAFGAVNQDRVSIMLLNRGPSPFEYSLGLNQAPTGGAVLTLRVNAGRPRVHHGTLEGHASTVLVFQRDRLTRWHYRAEDFQATRFPSITEGDHSAAESLPLQGLEPVTLKRGAAPVSLPLPLAGPCVPAKVTGVSRNPALVSVSASSASSTTRTLMLTAHAPGTTIVDFHITTARTKSCKINTFSSSLLVTVTDETVPPAQNQVP